MCDYVMNNANKVFNAEVTQIEMEYSTPVGAIDMFMQFKHGYMAAELKRTKASINAVYQLHRYMTHIKKQYPECLGYLIAPDIGVNALNQLTELDYKFIKLPIQTILDHNA